jgi:mersacidin/lichenicidin family type 2 lantibiotic
MIVSSAMSKDLRKTQTDGLGGTCAECTREGIRNMSKKIDVVKAWKDDAYRASLSEADRAILPDNPAGVVELSEEELEGVAGGANSTGATSCCIYIN